MAEGKKTGNKPTQPSNKLPEDGAAPVDRLLDGFLFASARFGRFGWDVLGVALLAAAVITLLALLSLSQGTLLSPWVDFLRKWFGWGSYLFTALTGFGGGLALRRRFIKEPNPPIAWGKILAVEAMAFDLLALLAVVGGGSLERAMAGLDGGLVGWAIAEFPVILGLDATIRTALLALLLFFLLAWGLGINDLLLAWVDRQVQSQASSPPEDVTPGFQPYTPASFPPPSNNVVQVISKPESGPPKPEKTPPAVRKTNPAQLPVEYRKNFRVDKNQVEPGDTLPERSDLLPPLNMLYGEQSSRPDERYINHTAGLIEKTMAEFGVPAKVVGFRIGPTVTQFAVEPGFVEKPGPDGVPQKQKVRVSQISGLSRDLALALSAERLRIEAPVPGRSYVGVEVPNSRSTVVRLRSLLEADDFYKTKSQLAIALGKDVSGQSVIADLARMPHLLIAGTTGSGKSVCIEALTACLVANNSPDDLRLVMIDPKMVELVRFNGLPHMYGKVETNLERILAVLRWALSEMDHRYRLLEQARVRDLEAYNRKVEKRGQTRLPRIVVMIDELADLMMSAPDQTEHSLVRLAQMARATGIHLVVATQRPSTDVVTGLIKANFPARIAFTVASSIDSRVILDTPGAETLLGRGDMLFLNPETGTPLRVQGVLVTDQEIDRLISFWQKAAPSPADAVPPWEELLNQDETGDSLTEQAITLLRGAQRVSTSLLQRKLRIGYPRAARLMDELEEMGVVGPSQGGGRDREVLIDPEDQDETDSDDS